MRKSHYQLQYNTILIICVGLIYILFIECGMLFSLFLLGNARSIVFFFSNKNATYTRIVYCLAFHPSPSMLKYQ